MNLSQRLRTCAKHTGLDAVIELLTEAADEIDRLSAGQPADVTDERILDMAKDAGFSYNLCSTYTLKGNYAQLEKFARAILALRPVQVPMTDEELCEALNIDGSDDWTYQVRDAVEAHHGIKPKEQA